MITYQDYLKLGDAARAVSAVITEHMASEAYSVAAQQMGIKLKNQWIATLDNRTRHTHGELDHQCAEVGEPFANGCCFPGDPNGKPSETYNCRCTMVSVLDGVREAEPTMRRIRDPATGKNVLVKDITYKEWLAAKKLQNATQSGIMKARKGENVTIRSMDMPIEQRNTGKGNPNAIAQVGRPLNNRQQCLLNELPTYDSCVIVPKKNVNMRDLSALTAETGNEFALFTKGNERLIVRGDATHVNVDTDLATKLCNECYKWSGHTHPGMDKNCLTASYGDVKILECFKQDVAYIFNSKGQYLDFGKR